MFNEVTLLFCQMKGLARARGGSYGRAEFIVKVYQAEDPHKRLVEFQRRSGCLVVFNILYKEVIDKIVSLGTPNVVERLTLSHSTRMRLPSIQGLHNPEIEVQGKTCKDIDEQTFRNLVDLASSSFVDIQQEALGGLACATSGREKHHYITWDESFSNFLLKAIQSQDDIVCENACQFLVNICTDERIRYAVSQQFRPSIHKKLHSPTSLGTMHIKRTLKQVLKLIEA